MPSKPHERLLHGHVPSLLQGQIVYTSGLPVDSMGLCEIDFGHKHSGGGTKRL